MLFSNIASSSCSILVVEVSAEWGVAEFCLWKQKLSSLSTKPIGSIVRLGWPNQQTSREESFFCCMGLEWKLAVAAVNCRMGHQERKRREVCFWRPWKSCRPKEGLHHVQVHVYAFMQGRMWPLYRALHVKHWIHSTWLNSVQSEKSLNSAFADRIFQAWAQKLKDRLSVLAGQCSKLQGRKVSFVAKNLSANWQR